MRADFVSDSGHFVAMPKRRVPLTISERVPLTEAPPPPAKPRKKRVNVTDPQALATKKRPKKSTTKGGPDWVCGGGPEMAREVIKNLMACTVAQIKIHIDKWSTKENPIALSGVTKEQLILGIYQWVAHGVIHREKWADLKKTLFHPHALLVLCFSRLAEQKMLENPFVGRSLNQVVFLLEHFPEEIHDAQQLVGLRGIGDSCLTMVREILATGKLARLEGKIEGHTEGTTEGTTEGHTEGHTECHTECHTEGNTEPATAKHNGAEPTATTAGRSEAPPPMGAEAPWPPPMEESEWMWYWMREQGHLERDGVTVAQLAQRWGLAETEARARMEQWYTDGRVYSTIDEDHWRVSVQ